MVGVKDAKRLLEDLPNKIAATMGLVCEVNLLAKNGVEYIEIVVPASKLPVSYHGVFHMRSGATKQELSGNALQDFLLKKNGLTWDALRCHGATMEDIDEEAVRYFVRRAVSYGRMPEDAKNDSVTKIFENLNLFDDDHQLTNAAVLLFGKRPKRFFPLCEFCIGRFGRSQADLMFDDVIDGDLIRMSDKVIATLRSKYLISPIHYEGLIRAEPLEIPEPVLREAALNAIIHKDYRGVHIQMKVWNDRVEIWNQGNLPSGWVAEDLFKKHLSVPRNPNIAMVFYLAGFIEKWGRGVDKICEGLRENDLKMPDYSDFLGGVQFVLYRKDCFVSSEGTKYSLGGEGKTREKTGSKILNAIREDSFITTSQLADICNLTEKGIEYHLSNLKKQGKLRRVGPDKGGHWEVL